MYDLDSFCIEVTRRCNLSCAHCMRGDAQDIDIDFEDVKKFLMNPEIKSIKHILFTGGEPTLNAKVISETIRFIIENNLDVHAINMVTNGNFNGISLDNLKDMRDSFCDFIRYRKAFNREKFGSVAVFHNYFPSINLGVSSDDYHDGDISDALEYYKDFGPTKHKFTTLLKKGRSNEGQSKNLFLDNIKYLIGFENDIYGIEVYDGFYLTANGNVTRARDASFDEEDAINYGSVDSFSITDVLTEYGVSSCRSVRKDDKGNMIIVDDNGNVLFRKNKALEKKGNK